MSVELVFPCRKTFQVLCNSRNLGYITKGREMETMGMTMDSIITSHKLRVVSRGEG